MKSDCDVTCFCGYTGDLDEFTNTPVAGAMDPGSYQCPECKRAWRVEKGAIHIHNGQMYSDPNRIVAVQSRL